MGNSKTLARYIYLWEEGPESAGPVAARPDVDAHVVILRGRRDVEWVPARQVPNVQSH